METALKKLVRKNETVLCIDIGNSKAKGAVYKNGMQTRYESQFDPAMARIWIEELKPAGVIISSVGGGTEPFIDAANTAASGKTLRLVVVSSAMALPFAQHYADGRLGVDRIAGICGAMLAYPGRNCLVMDAGTCLTYDIVTADGQHMGGAISPGLQMRLKALHTFTHCLPLLSPVGNAPLAGLSTEDCIMSGALNGFVFEAERFIDKFSAMYSNLKTVLTGGGAQVLEQHLEKSYDMRPKLVLEGLLLLYYWQETYTLALPEIERTNH